MSPFKAIYRRDPPPFLRLVEEPSRIEEANALIRQRNEVLNRLKQNLHIAQERMKKRPNKNRKELEFSMANQIFLKLPPYRFRSLAIRLNDLVLVSMGLLKLRRRLDSLLAG